MRLADLVDTSRLLAETSSRAQKIAALAAFLRRLAPREIAIGVAYLSGHLRQGRIGLGAAALAGARSAAPAARAALSSRKSTPPLPAWPWPAAAARQARGCVCSPPCSRPPPRGSGTFSLA